MNGYPETMEQMSVQTYFRYNDPKAITQAQGALIEVQSKAATSQKQRSTKKGPKREEHEESTEMPAKFSQNPNLGNVIKRIEERQKRGSGFTAAEVVVEEPSEESRTKKFKKPLDSLGAR